MNAIHNANMSLKQRAMKEVRIEYERRYEEHQQMIQQDIAVQLTAATLYTLATWHGWGKVRLKRFVGELNSTFEDMNGAGFAGKFDTGDLEQLVLEKYGIDLDKEIEVVSKKGGRK